MPDKADDPPRDYKVPHFGTDSDIKNSLEDIKLAEKQLGHFWVPKDKPDDPPRNYFVPNFGYDSDIAASLKNLNDSEAKYGKMKTPEITW